MARAVSWANDREARCASNTGCWSMSAPDKDVIERFCDAIWLQEGLSANTLDAYRRDLEGLSRWLAPRGSTLMTASRGDLLDYLSGCVGKGARPRTTAR